MTLLFTAIIITAILTLVIGGVVGSLRNKNIYINNKKPSFALCALGLLGLLVIVPGLFTTVSANQVGIIYDELNGGVQDQTYGEGLHVKSIFETITEISTANRSASLTTTGQTNDGQYATFQLSIIYKIKTEDAGKFFRVTNNVDISKEAISTLVKSSLQSSTIKYDIFQLLSTGLETARIDFKEDLAEQLYTSYFITLVEVSFDDIDGGREVENILQQKAEAQQKIKIAELNAEAEMITASNKAEIEKTLAEAEAYAIKTKGEASGDAANGYTSKVLSMIDNLYNESNGVITYKEASDLVLSIVFYDTWNGELPEVLTSDSLSSMIGSLIKGTETN